MSEYRFTADEVWQEMVAETDDVIDVLARLASAGNTRKTVRIKHIMLFYRNLMIDRIRMQASLKGTMWDKEPSLEEGGE